MKVAEKLSIINSIEVIDDDCTGGQVEAVWVDLQTPILEAMKKVGMSDQDILDYVRQHVDISDSVPYLNIVLLGFKICGAEGYATKGGFLDELPTYRPSQSGGIF